MIVASVYGWVEFHSETLPAAWSLNINCLCFSEFIQYLDHCFSFGSYTDMKENNDIYCKYQKHGVSLSL